MTNNKNWAYGALTMNNADLGVGTIYYAAGYFTSVDPANIAITNPANAEKCTAEEISTIIAGAEQGGDKYVTGVPAGALLGISANGTGKVFWFDQDAAKAILSHADALMLGADTGVMAAAADGSEVARPMA